MFTTQIQSAVRSLVAILLVGCIAFSYSGKAGIVLLYLTNQNYIAVNLCENSNKPKMHCKGKCYLLKQLKNEEANSKKAAGTPINITELEDIIMDIHQQDLFLDFPHFRNNGTWVFVPRFAVCSFSTAIFHPPA